MPAPSNIVLTPTSGVAPFSVSISGTDLFERPSYTRKETFTVAAPNSLPAGWVGTDPTRVDSIIGKGVTCSTTGARYLAAFTTGDTTTAGSNDLWPGSNMVGLTSIFISLWIKPSSLSQACLINVIRGSAVAPVNPPVSTLAQATIALQTDGRLTFAISQGGSALRKIVYTATGAIVNNVWQHVLCQWTSVAPGVSVDPPVIWIDGIKKSTTSYVNGNFTTITPVTNTQGCSTIGYGYGPSQTPPANTWGLCYFNGSICDVYTGATFLSDADILKYANLPKVELIKV
jgi:hypothetical protein